MQTRRLWPAYLPTEIQTNIGGRMCFKLPTSSDSVTAIGNKKAYELPDVKGRAIWHHGNDYTQVQGPYLSNEEIKEEIKRLKEKFTKLEVDEEKEEVVADNKALGKAGNAVGEMVSDPKIAA